MIELRDVHKLYKRGTQEVRALSGISLHIAPREFVAIMGPSGSGKSTLLHLVGALDTPSQGEVRVAGEALAGADDATLTRLRRAKIGFVFQFFNLLATLTARENIVLAGQLGGMPAKDAFARADKLLGQVGLEGRGGHHPDELSGGEMQRVAIARALIKEPVLLLADEPTGNLDSATGTEILALLKSLHQGGLTIVMVTHDLNAARTAEGVLHLRDGRLIEDTRKPISSPGHRER